MPIDYNKISADFVADLDLMQEQLVKKIEQGLRGNLSAIDLATLDAQIDFFEELNALGYESKVTEYIKNYDQVIIEIHNEAVKRGVVGVKGVIATDLELLALNEEIFLLDKGRLYTQQFKNAIYRSIIGGETLGELLPSLRSIPLTDSQLTIGLSTGINRFNRTATAKVYAETPNQRFKLQEDPLDERTRASCAGVIRHQPKGGWTKAEIDGGAATMVALAHMNETEHSPSEVELLRTNGYTFINAGFWNCRHDWMPI
jgi:hypothetical protein